MAPGHPLFGKLAAACQAEYDPSVVQVAAELVLAVPDNLYGNPTATEQYLDDHVLPAYLAGRAAESGKKAADRQLLPAVEAAIRAATVANDTVRDHLQSRRDLPDQRVDVAGIATTYRGNRESLATNSAIADGLRATGHTNMLQSTRSRLTLPIGLAIAAVETTVSTRLFNISVTDFDLWSWLGFLGFTALEVVVTVIGPTHVVGPRRRRLRELLFAARRLNTASASSTTP